MDIVPLLGKLTIEHMGAEEPEEVTLDLDMFIPINDNLSEEFSRQPSLYAYLAMLAAQTDALYQAAKTETQRVRAQVDQRIREDAKDDGEKVTEAIVDKRVVLDGKVQEAEDTESNYRYQFMMMKVVVAAMEQRAQMLISLGAHLRAEADQTGMLIHDAKTHLDSLRQSR